MKSIYIARSYSDMLHRGGAHYISNPNEKDIKNEYEYTRINKIMIPKMLESVYKILTP